MGNEMKIKANRRNTFQRKARAMSAGGRFRAALVGDEFPALGNRAARFFRHALVENPDDSDSSGMALAVVAWKCGIMARSPLRVARAANEGHGLAPLLVRASLERV
jgi:hypothetical protein